MKTIAFKARLYCLITYFGIIANQQYQQIVNPIIEKTYIIGCKNFSASQIKTKAMKLLNKQPINKFKLALQLKEIDFIDDIALRISHNQLFIHIKEKTPIAQTTDNKLITNNQQIISSKMITDLNLIKIAHKNDLREVELLITLLTEYQIYPSLSVYIRSGRWNLLIDNKIIKLPKNDLKQSIKNLQSFIINHPTHYAFSNSIDFRKEGYAIITNIDLDQYLSKLS